MKDVTSDRYVNGVHVNVLGIGQFKSGLTDLRGVFVAEGVQGPPTVIAEADAGKYAFFRSPAVAQEQPYPAMAPPQAAWEPVEKYRSMRLEARSVSENEQRIMAALDSPTAFEFIETPLQDVINYLKKLHRIEIQLDQRALDDVWASRTTRQLPGPSGVSPCDRPWNCCSATWT